jgi:hypothetical protein
MTLVRVAGYLIPAFATREVQQKRHLVCYSLILLGQFWTIGIMPLIQKENR